MTGEVVSLREVAPPDLSDGADKELVAALSKILRDAEAGRIHAMAFAAIVTDDDGDRSSRTAFVAPSGSDCEWMIGCVETLKLRLLHRSFDSARAPDDWPAAPA